MRLVLKQCANLRDVWSAVAERSGDTALVRGYSTLVDESGGGSGIMTDTIAIKITTKARDL